MCTRPYDGAVGVQQKGNDMKKDDVVKGLKCCAHHVCDQCTYKHVPQCALILNLDAQNMLEQFYELPAITEDDLKAARDKGRAEAWTTANMIAGCECNGGFPSEWLIEVFGTPEPAEVLSNYTAQEAKEKIDSWAKRRTETTTEFRVGDVIKTCLGKGIITSVSEDGIHFLHKNGGFGWSYHKEYTKTGEHIDLTALFDQIGE